VSEVRLAVAQAGAQAALLAGLRHSCCDAGPGAGPRPKGERGAGWAGWVWASNWSRLRLREGKENPFYFL